MDMEFNISDYSMPVAICGQNNVGKTNTLRAINLFFNPNTLGQEWPVSIIIILITFYAICWKNSIN